ncbi:MAG: glutamine synthetase [Pseudonocardia sp.]|nr:glutamine synthetase [Pseudonocardia sp.]
MFTDQIPATHYEAAAVDIAAALDDKQVSMVAITFVDTAGITRVKCIPTARLAHAATVGVGASPVFDTFCFDDSMVFGRHLGGPDGDLRLIPDLTRLVPLACQPGWAWAPADKFTQEGPRFLGCQRHFAAAQVAAAEEHGLTLRMAFESEWSLGLDQPDFVPAFEGPAYGLIRLGPVADYAGDIVSALTRQGLAVEQFHPEYALAQLELSIAPKDPVGAADDVVLVRHTVRQISAQRGWRASFAPTVDPNGAGSGAHLHLSVTDGDGSALAGGTGPYGMRPAGEAFLAGVLRELPALCAIGAAHPTSYVRLQPSRWAGVWQCWGRETRETALRFITGVVGTEASAANAEVKCFDATGNPYLVVGAVIAAGLAGVAERLTLPPDISGDPAGMSERDRASAGISRLPTSLSEAAEAFAGSKVLAAAMGEVLYDTVLTMRRGDAERFADTSSYELAALSRWRY